MDDKHRSITVGATARRGVGRCPVDRCDRPRPNLMLYKDDLPNVEVGIEVTEPFATIGRVVSSTLPPGRVATTTHRGRYEDLGAAHLAVIDWCDLHELQ